jgi:hypothetical protein
MDLKPADWVNPRPFDIPTKRPLSCEKPALINA